MTLNLFTNMAPLTNEDKILIKTLRLEKGWSVLRMMREFPSRKNEMISFFSRMERRHTVHATLSLTCAPMCPNSLNRKTGRQTVLWIIQCGGGGVATDGVSSQNFRH